MEILYRKAGMPVSLVTLAGLLLCASCASSVKPLSREIYRDRNIQVLLIKEKDAADGKGFDHPWEVDLATLDALLQSVTYRRGILIHRNKVRDAFPAEVRADLVAHLQTAFAQAEPDEKIDFSFLHHVSWTVFQKEFLTDGVLFRKGGKLNCAFRNLTFDHAVGSEQSEQPYAGDPTQRPPRTDWELTLQEGQEIARSGFPNWIQLDLARDWTARKKPEESVAATVEAVPETAPAPGAGQAGAAESPAEPPEPPRVVQPPSAAAAQDQPLPASRQEIDERLRFLEELHREGDLADRAYEQKRQELIKLREQLP
ncbi:MAG: hypothetical protein AB1640_14705 [bacterium]